jgi:hypothetical protein
VNNARFEDERVDEVDMVAACGRCGAGHEILCACEVRPATAADLNKLLKLHCGQHPAFGAGGSL